jgi:membrane-bound inhibitor of C-type lysozyme
MSLEDVFCQRNEEPKMSRIAVSLMLWLAGLSSVLAGGGDAMRVGYACDRGSRVEATYTGQHARVILNGRTLEMDTALSGSGARYVGDGYTWWTKGKNADLYKGVDLATIRAIDHCAAR